MAPVSHPGRLGEVANDRFGEFQFAEPGFRSMAAAGKPLLPFWVGGSPSASNQAASGCYRPEADGNDAYQQADIHHVMGYS